MRLVIARCSVDYVGRLTAHLPSAPRLLIVKADGSVLVHSDGGSYKPLNWMSPPCRLEESPGAWRVVNKAGEELLITIEEVLHDSSHQLGTDPGLVKDGVEAHLQELLAAQPDVLGAGWRLVHFPGDQMPLGYSLFDVAAGVYRERGDAPVTTADPGGDPEPMDDDTRAFLRQLVTTLGGKEFP